jgi:hypothetical protein
MHITTFIGGEPGAPKAGDVPAQPFGPMAFLVEQPPHSIIKTHFHRIDQWQVVVDGDGLLGSHHVSPVSLHFSAAYSPYGPIKAGENGLSYFTLRADYDRGANYMPDSQKDLRANRTSPHREAFLQAGVPVDRHELGTLDDAKTEVLVEPHADGLAAWRLLIAPFSNTVGPDPKAGGGQTWVVLQGELLVNGKALPPKSCLFVSSGDDPIDLLSASSGVEVLCVQYPRRKN